MELIEMPSPGRMSLELLETFVALANNDGDATRAALELGVNQPSVSKRLSALRRFTAERIGQSWLVRKGKRWRLTREGERVRLVVADMLGRYEQMERFVASASEGTGVVSIACGQQAAIGVVRGAIERFLRERPECRVRISTPRGAARIAGVAGGQYDFAVVSDSPAVIRKISRREMYIEALFDDHFVLVGSPDAKSGWGHRWKALSNNAPIDASALVDFPFILPESEASRRKQFNDWFYKATKLSLQARLEAGGWQTILGFVESGLGVGLVPSSAVEAFQERSRRTLTTRMLDPAQFPPDAMRLIARKAHAREEPDLTDVGRAVVSMLRDEAQHAPSS